MFFKTKRDRCKTKRQTLHTEQLEPKAMFSVSPVEPVVALDVGPVNQASVEDCMIVHPQYNLGGSADPGGDDVFMPKPNRVGRAYSLEGQAFLTGVNSLAQANQQPSLTNVWTNGSATSMAPRYAAFAMMGR